MRLLTHPCQASDWLCPRVLTVSAPGRHVGSWGCLVHAFRACSQISELSESPLSGHIVMKWGAHSDRQLPRGARQSLAPTLGPSPCSPGGATQVCVGPGRLGLCCPQQELALSIPPRRQGHRCLFKCHPVPGGETAKSSFCGLQPCGVSVTLAWGSAPARGKTGNHSSVASRGGRVQGRPG